MGRSEEGLGGDVRFHVCLRLCLSVAAFVHTRQSLSLFGDTSGFDLAVCVCVSVGVGVVVCFWSSCRGTGVWFGFPRPGEEGGGMPGA